MAALIRMSIGAHSAHNLATASRSVTSHCIVVTPSGKSPARSGLRLIAITFAPNVANCFAAANPMPDVPPKITAFLPDTSIINLLCFPW